MGPMEPQIPGLINPAIEWVRSRVFPAYFSRGRRPRVRRNGTDWGRKQTVASHAWYSRVPRSVTAAPGSRGPGRQLARGLDRHRLPDAEGAREHGDVLVQGLEVVVLGLGVDRVPPREQGVRLQGEADGAVGMTPGGVDMDPGLHHDVEDDRELLARRHHGIRGVDRDLQLVAGGPPRRVLSRSRVRPQLQGQGVPRHPRPVTLLEEAIGDPALRIQDERARKRNAEVRVVGSHLGVQEAIAPDDGGAGVAEERVGDPLAFRERGGDLCRVTADGGQAQSPLREGILLSLQLHELRPAIRSPVCGPEEDEHEAPGSHEGLQGVLQARLIGKGEAGGGIADLGPEGGDVDVRVAGHGLLSGNEKEKRREEDPRRESCRHREMVHDPGSGSPAILYIARE